MCKLDVFPLDKYFIPDADALGRNKNIYNVPHLKMEVKSNTTLLGFGVEDITDELESPYISRFQSFKPCLDQEKYIVPPVNNTPINDETRVDNITYLESLHHASGVNDMPPYSNLKEDVVHKGINHSLENLFLPPFPLKGEDVINDAPS